MPGPDWSRDEPGDAGRVGANAAALLADLHASAAARIMPSAATVKDWHARLYAGCAVPDPAYVGRFRGDRATPSLQGYEVGVGPVRGDGCPGGMGVWSGQVEGQVDTFLEALRQAVEALDAAIPVGARAVTTVELREVVALTAIAHGEWIRIHPFANGNGRTARLWAAFTALRYGLPVFVKVKPRPDGVLYARAAAASMGRPPDFVGDHAEAIAVFTHWLRRHLEA